MSNLINQNWIGFDGKPITGRTPPTIRMMAGVMTRPLMAEVAHRYQLFCMGKQTALGDYFVADKIVADGSRVRITSINGVDTVFVWAKALSEDEDDYLAGFMFRPQDSVNTDGTDLTFWGAPFTSFNLPLGTPGGDRPFSTLSPKLKKDAAGQYKAADIYKFRRGVPNLDKLGREAYGQIDWQGPNPKTDVISWYAESVDGLVYGNSFLPDVYMDQWGIQSYGYYGDDPDKSKYLVLRKRNFGTGSVVCSKLKVIKVFPSGGLVDGAGFTQKDANGQRHMITALRTGSFAGVSFTFIKTPIKLGETKAPSRKMVPVYEAPESDADDIVLGTYAPDGLMTNMHSWYFNQSGTKARTVLLGKDDQFAVEATFTEDGMTVAEIPGSRGSTTGDYWTASGSYQWSPPIGTQPGTFVRTSSGSSTGSARSPASVADFQGDVGVMLCFEEELVRPGSMTGTFTRVYPVGEINIDDTYVMTSDTGYMAKRAVLISHQGGATSEKYIPLSPTNGGSVTNLQQHRTNTTQDGTDWNQTEAVTQTLSVTPVGNGGTYRHIIDADLRCEAFSFFEEVNGAGNYAQHMTSEEIGTTVSGVTTTSSTMTQTSSDVVTTAQVTTVGTAASKTTSWPTKTDAGGTTTGPMQYMFYYLDSPVFGGATAVGPFPPPEANTVEDWNRLYTRNTSFQSINGMIRTYYGQALSTTLVGAGMDPMPPWYENQPSKGVSHLVGDVAADAAAIAQIDTQPMPWLARLGVI